MGADLDVPGGAAVFMVVVDAVDCVALHAGNGGLILADGGHSVCLLWLSPVLFFGE